METLHIFPSMVKYAALRFLKLSGFTGTLLAVILTGSCDLHYIHRVDEREFAFSTRDIRSELDDIPLTHPAVRNWLRDFIDEGEESLQRREDN